MEGGSGGEGAIGTDIFFPQIFPLKMKFEETAPSPFLGGGEGYIKGH